MPDLIIQVDDKEFDVSYIKNEPSNITINGKDFYIEHLKEIDENIHAFSVNNRVCQIEFDLDWDGTSTIYIDGFNFDVKVTDETRKLLKKFIQAARGSTNGNSMKLKAPMPGLVVKHIAEVGDEVKKGDPVIIIEAMKMENALKANEAGRVKKILVEPGQPVEKDAVLVEFEAL